jgi:uridine kinase
VISQDDYYLPIEQQPKDFNGIENFDLPKSIDHKALLKDIALLEAGNTIEKKEYTFNNPGQAAKTITFEPAPVMIVEGIFVMYHEELRQQFDLTIFIDAPEHIRLKRRILRDTEERGYDLADILYRFEHHVMPTHLQFIEPYKSAVDIVINSNEGFERIINMVLKLVNMGVKG